MTGGLSLRLCSFFLVEQALAKNPEDRFASATAFADALTSQTLVAPIVGSRPPQRLIVAAASSAVLVVAVIVSTVLRSPEGDERQGCEL